MRVLLPVPDSPATRTLSPILNLDVGLVHDRAAVVERDREIAQAKRGAVGVAVVRCAPSFLTVGAVEAPERLQDRRHTPLPTPSTREPRVVVHDQLNATCTVTNADVACITCPRVIVPATYSARRGSANDGTNAELVCETTSSAATGEELAPALQPLNAASAGAPLRTQGDTFALRSRSVAADDGRLADELRVRPRHSLILCAPKYVAGTMTLGK